MSSFRRRACASAECYEGGRSPGRRMVDCGDELSLSRRVAGASRFSAPRSRGRPPGSGSGSSTSRPSPRSPAGRCSRRSPCWRSCSLTERTRTVAAFRSIGWFGLLSAVLLAISSGTFFLALNYTTVANVLFMQAAAPFFAALLGWWLLGDRVARRTWWAMALAAVGVVVMAIGSLDAGLERGRAAARRDRRVRRGDRDHQAPPRHLDDAGHLHLAGDRRGRLPAPFASFATAGALRLGDPGSARVRSDGASGSRCSRSGRG